MKNSLFINASLFCGLIIGLFSFVNGQSTISFSSGIRMSVKMENTSPGSEKSSFRGLGTLETIDGRDIYHRILVDPENSIYYGYDVEVTRSGESDKFKVAIKPLSYKPKQNDKLGKFSARPIPKYPDETTIGSGDLLKLEILENPQTKAKIIDYYKIADATKPFDTAFTEDEPTRDFTMDDVNLKLEQAAIFAGGKKVGQLGGGTWGANVYFTVPGKGRFILSPFPRNGYNFQKIGTIIDNKLLFTYESEKYEVKAKSAILGEGGHWNVWVMYDPAYQWKSSPDYPLSIQFGAADKVEYFFRKKTE